MDTPIWFLYEAYNKYFINKYGCERDLFCMIIKCKQNLKSRNPTVFVEYPRLEFSKKTYTETNKSLTRYTIPIRLTEFIHYTTAQIILISSILNFDYTTLHNIMSHYESDGSNDIILGYDIKPNGKFVGKIYVDSRDKLIRWTSDSDTYQTYKKISPMYYVLTDSNGKHMCHHYRNVDPTSWIYWISYADDKSYSSVYFRPIYPINWLIGISELNSALIYLVSNGKWPH